MTCLDKMKGLIHFFLEKMKPGQESKYDDNKKWNQDNLLITINMQNKSEKTSIKVLHIPSTM